MTVGKVKDFNFSSSGKTVGLCNGSMTKMASGGQAVQMAKSNAVKKSMAGQKMTKMASGGYYAEGGKWIQEAVKKPGALRAALHVKEGKNIPKGKLEAAAKKPGLMGQRARLAETLGKMRKADGGPITEEMTGETYPSRSAMVKHESLETPRMQKQEMVQKSTVRAPALKLKTGRAAAGKAAIAPQMPMKKGGFVERGTGMIPSKGTLGVKNNKNPGEMGGKAPIKSHPKYNFAEGGPVQKYADGGQAMRAAMANRGAQGRMPPQGAAPQMSQQQAMQAMQAMQQRMPPQGMPPQGMAAPMGQREALQAMMQQRMQQMPQGMPPKGMPSRGMPPQGSPEQQPAMRGMKKGGSTSMNKINISPALTKAIINAKMK